MENKPIDVSNRASIRCNGVASAKNVLTGEEVTIPSLGHIVEIDYLKFSNFGESIEDSTWTKETVTGIVLGYGETYDVLSFKLSKSSHMHLQDTLSICATDGKTHNIPCSHVLSSMEDPPLPSKVHDSLESIYRLQVVEQHEIFRRRIELHRQIDKLSEKAKRKREDAAGIRALLAAIEYRKLFDRQIDLHIQIGEQCEEAKRKREDAAGIRAWLAQSPNVGESGLLP